MLGDRYVGAVEASDWCTRHAILNSTRLWTGSQWKLSKVASCNILHLNLAPPLGVTPVEFCQNHRQQKSRVSVLLCDVVCVILRLAVSVEHRLVSDRQTDRQRGTHTTTAYTALAWRRAVKVVQKLMNEYMHKSYVLWDVIGWLFLPFRQSWVELSWVYALWIRVSSRKHY